MSSSAPLMGRLDHDFSLFRSEINSPANLRLECYESELPIASFPEVESKDIRERCIVFKDGNHRWTLYHGGRALVIWNIKEDCAKFYSVDPELLHELAYLFILSRTGELLDKSGFHRIHASAICKNGKAVLCCLPSGGGKTTLAMAALNLPGWQFLSDDSPYISRTGEILAFPTRLGVQDRPDHIEQKIVREFHRQEHGLKYLIDANFYAGKVAERAEPAVFIVGTRKLSGPPQITRISKAEAWLEAAKALIVGVGLPQLIEYFLRLDWQDILSKVGIVASRSIACFQLIRRSTTYKFALGPDLQENIATYHSFLNTVEQEDQRKVFRTWSKI